MQVCCCGYLLLNLPTLLLQHKYFLDRKNAVGSICLMLVLKHLEQVLNYRTIAFAIHKPKHPIFSIPDLGIEKFMELADGEFGRVQARNMLQHLWTGPISNAAVDVVQGSKSVEVRPIGVSKVSIHSLLFLELS